MAPTFCQLEECVSLAASLGFLDKTMLGRFEMAHGMRSLFDEEGGGWRVEVKRLWGSRLGRGRLGSWRTVAEYCETTTARTIATKREGVCEALHDLCSAGALRPSICDEQLPCPADRADCLLAIAARGERSGSWIARRLVASFVTSSVGGTLRSRPRSWRRLSEVPGTAEHEHQETLRLLARALAPRLADADVEEALRRALAVFPFLPAASSHGADRVIEALARAYVAAKHPLDARDAFDATYVIWYSLVLLNTDLHNDRITAKITEDGFVRSLSRTILHCAHPEGLARHLYKSIKQRPLVADNPDLRPSARDKWAFDFARFHHRTGRLPQSRPPRACYRRVIFRFVSASSLLCLVVAAVAMSTVALAFRPLQ